jgi:hypothetical protein
MKKIFWNVGIEIYEDGTVKAAVLRSREAASQPSTTYKRNQWMEAVSLWCGSKAEAQGAVIGALALNRKLEVAA